MSSMPEDDDFGGLDAIHTSHRDLFADYYGLDLQESDASSMATPVDEDGDGAGEQKLGDFAMAGDQSYNEQRVTASERLNIDGAHFNAQIYVDNLLSQHDMRVLVERNNEISSARKSLDNSMQMLVYQNYNKFIDATDKMREMKDNVEDMEEEMNTLLVNMRGIERGCAKIETALDPNREKVESLVGASRMLSSLKFLLDLPGRLQRCVDREEYKQAVQYYSVASRILSRYAHVTSFDKIRGESQEIISALKKILKEGAYDASGDHDVPLDRVYMLFELDEPLEELLTTFFESRKIAFLRAHDVAVQERKKNSGPGAASMFQLLDSNFLEPFALFIDAFRSRFLAVDVVKKSGVESEGIRKSNESLARKKLVEFTTEIMGVYFETASFELQGYSQIDRLLTTDTDGGSRSNPSAQDGEKSLRRKKERSAAAETLTTGLRHFFSGVLSVGRRVPEFSARKQAADIVLEVLRKCLRSTFLLAKKEVSTILGDFHDYVVLHFDPRYVRVATEQDKKRTSSSSSRRRNSTRRGSTSRNPFAAPSSSSSSSTSLSSASATKGASGKNPFGSSVPPSTGGPSSNPFASPESTTYSSNSGGGKNPFDSSGQPGEREKGKEKEKVSLKDKLVTTLTKPFKQRSSAGSDGASREQVIDSETVERCANQCSDQLRRAVEDGVEWLIDVLKQVNYLSAEMNAEVDSVLYSSLQQHLQWMVSAMSYNCMLESDNSVLARPVVAGADVKTGGIPEVFAPLAELRSSLRKHPRMYLYLFKAMQQLEAVDVPRLLLFVKKTVSSNREGSEEGASHFEASFGALLGRTRESAQALLQRYVETHGIKLAGMANEYLQAGFAASMEEPTQMSPHLRGLVTELGLADAELGLVFPKARVYDAVERRTLLMKQRHRRKSQESKQSNRSGANSRAQDAAESRINRKFDRLFKQKIKIFGEKLRFTRSSPLCTIYRALFRAVIEGVRSRAPFYASGYQQLQVDVFALRLHLHSHVYLSSEDIKTLEMVLDEALTSGMDRVCEPDKLRALEEREIMLLFAEMPEDE
jgi:hypothetical protein